MSFLSQYQTLPADHAPGISPGFVSLQGVFGLKNGFGRNESDPYQVGTKGGFGITGVGNRGIGNFNIYIKCFGPFSLQPQIWEAYLHTWLGVGQAEST